MRSVYSSPNSKTKSKPTPTSTTMSASSLKDLRASAPLTSKHVIVSRYGNIDAPSEAETSPENKRRC